MGARRSNTRRTGIATTQSSKRGDTKEQLGESTLECVAATTTITTTTEPTRRRGKMKRCGHSPDYIGEASPKVRDGGRLHLSATLVGRELIAPTICWCTVYAISFAQALSRSGTKMYPMKIYNIFSAYKIVMLFNNVLFLYVYIFLVMPLGVSASSKFKGYRPFAAIKSIFF